MFAFRNINMIYISKFISSVSSYIERMTVKSMYNMVGYIRNGLIMLCVSVIIYFIYTASNRRFDETKEHKKDKVNANQNFSESV